MRKGVLQGQLSWVGGCRRQEHEQPLATLVLWNSKVMNYVHLHLSNLEALYLVYNSRVSGCDGSAYSEMQKLNISCLVVSTT